MENYATVSARTWKEIDRIAKLDRIATMNLDKGLQEEGL